MYNGTLDMYNSKLKIFIGIEDSFGDLLFIPKGTLQCSVAKSSVIIQDREGKQYMTYATVHFKNKRLTGDEYLLYEGRHMQIKKLVERLDKVSNRILGGIAYL